MADIYDLCNMSLNGLSERDINYILKIVEDRTGETCFVSQFFEESETGDLDRISNKYLIYYGHPKWFETRDGFIRMMENQEDQEDEEDYD